MASLPLYIEAYRRWLDHERDAHYWACVAAKAEKYDGRWTLTSTVLSGGSIVTLTSNLYTIPNLPLPGWTKVLVPACLGILGTAASHTNRHRGYAKKAAAYQLIRSICLQQLRAWKDVLDGIYAKPKQIASDAVLEQLRLRDAFVLSFEATHKQDDKIGSECEARARKLGETFRTAVRQRGGDSHDD